MYTLFYTSQHIKNSMIFKRKKVLTSNLLQLDGVWEEEQKK